jgi:CRISPR/Cas system CMR-associated protein Cmr5 small subunit
MVREGWGQRENRFEEWIEHRCERLLDDRPVREINSQSKLVWFRMEAPQALMVIQW